MEEIYKNLDIEDLEGEVWLPVEGYEGLYEVSNMGRIKSLNYNRTKQEKILKQGRDKDGYLFVRLSKNGKKKNCKIHRLVCQAFIENHSNLPQVNHKNEIKTDNRVENLEWCDAKYNCNYGTRLERIDYKAFQAKRVANTDWKAKVANTDYKAFQAKRVASTDYKAIAAKIDWKAKVANTDYKAIAEKLSKKVFQYSKNGTLVAIWKSTRECGRNGFNQRNVSDCCRGKLPHYKGFIWSYQEL